MARDKKKCTCAFSLMKNDRFDLQLHLLKWSPFRPARGSGAQRCALPRRTVLWEPRRSSGLAWAPRGVVTPGAIHRGALKAL